MVSFTGKKMDKPPKKLKEYRPVTDYMKRDLITFLPDQSIVEVMDTFLEKGISGAPVMDEHGKLVGIISEVDCLKIMVDEAYYNLPHGKITVAQYMSTSVSTIPITSDILDVASKFLSTNFRRYPIVDDNGKLVGQISRRDVLQATRDLKTSSW